MLCALRALVLCASGWLALLASPSTAQATDRGGAPGSAEIYIECHQQGVQVSLDGEAVLACPGTHTATLTPGEHRLVGEKPGFMPVLRVVVTLPGRVVGERITLTPNPTTEPRLPAWWPWTALGLGVAATGIGVYLRFEAQANSNAYGNALAWSCGSAGCSQAALPQQPLRQRAEAENTVAIVALATGGTLLAAGLGMAIINLWPAAEATPTWIVPEVTGTGVGVHLLHSF